MEQARGSLRGRGWAGSHGLTEWEQGISGGMKRMGEKGAVVWGQGSQVGTERVDGHGAAKAASRGAQHGPGSSRRPGIHRARGGE